MAIRQPLALSLRILEYRSYARVKDQVDAAKTDEQMPKGPMAELVFAVEHELIRERQARMAARAEQRAKEADR